MIVYDLPRGLANGEGIVSLGVRHAVTLCVCVRRISLGGEGNALCPVLSSYVIGTFSEFSSVCYAVFTVCRLTK